MKVVAREIMGFVGGRRGSTEVKLVEELMRYILQAELSDAKLRQAMSERGRRSEPDAELAKASKLLASDIAQEVLEFDEQEDDSDIREQLQELKRKREAHLRREAKRMQEVDRLRPAQSASSSSSSGAAPARRFIARPTSGYDAGGARAFLPPGASVSKDDRRENRWRVRAPYLRNLGAGLERSRSCGGPNGPSDHDAMLHVLQLVWRSYLQAHGGECPWSWDSLQQAGGAP